MQIKQSLISTLKALRTLTYGCQWHSPLALRSNAPGRVRAGAPFFCLNSGFDKKNKGAYAD